MKPVIRYRLIIILAAGLVLMFLGALVVNAQPPVPHPEEEDGISYEDCVYCHRTGEEDAPLLAADHAQHQNADCRVCHGTTGMLTPNISHPVAGWKDCRGCHDRWDGKDIEIPNLADSDYDHTIYESDTCVSCHPVATRYYDEVPPVACGVCHPKSAAAETIHNGPENWVDCVDCHQAAGNYPHDLERIHSRNEDCTSCHREREGHWTSDTPNKRYSLSDHVARGDPHAGVDCSACHLQVATVERNPTTGRIQVVLPETEEGVPPDSPELAVIGREVDCQRCHESDNRVAAPVGELPPRSVLCLACHDASPLVKDFFSWVGLGVFGLGMLMVASIWVRGTVDGQKGLSLLQRIWLIVIAILDLITTPRVFVLAWTFLLDGVLHRPVFRESRIRWLTHSLMFLAFLARMVLGVVTWVLALIVPTASLTQILVDKSAPGVAFVYDLLGLLVILGALLAIYRRFVVRDKQLVTAGQDTLAIALLGLIFLLGFVLEGARIVTTDLHPSLAVYSFVGYFFSLLLRLIPVAWGAVYFWLWYVHVALVAGLIAYLPFSKFFHVLISPWIAAINSALKARIP
ncbi:MAG: respiratory nitrate reductase subunit gamma [Anaerolineae bacterium]|nr:respiratory nitrate reductase subunit gamma [Anaerolineae bacterium]